MTCFVHFLGGGRVCVCVCGRARTAQRGDVCGGVVACMFDRCIVLVQFLSLVPPSFFFHFLGLMLCSVVPCCNDYEGGVFDGGVS